MVGKKYGKKERRRQRCEEDKGKVGRGRGTKIRKKSFPAEYEPFLALQYLTYLKQEGFLAVQRRKNAFKLPKRV
jgi:hypothetical protein